MDTSEKILKSYEHYDTSSRGASDSLFRVILPLSLAVAVGTGIVLTRMDISAVDVVKKAQAIRTRFMIEEPPPPPPPPKPKTPPKKVQQEPVDLTNNPEYGKEQDDVQKSTTPKEKPVRRVYGLRKVYSKGIGSGGSLSDAVVGKLGNTLNKDVDTLTATEKELKGRLVSTTTVDRPPRLKRIVKPEYTPEMEENGIEGVVKIKVLIDSDGTVKDAVALNDIGFGAAQRAVEAGMQWEFEPAIRDGEPVAVRIVVSVRFRLLGK